MPGSFAQHDDAKDRIRQAINIADLVGSYLDLRRQGRNFVALCPWHQDSRPSLQVNPERQSWKCWVCNIGGDIFSFVMQREGISFREALLMLAERAGIEIRSTPQAPIVPGSPDDKNTLFQASAWAEQQFHECLLKSPDAEPARRYLAERHISADSVAKFRVGYSPDSWQWLIDRARNTPYSVPVLEAVGLAGRSSTTDRPYDRFKGRLMFPIRDPQKRPIAFGGRVLPGLAKEDAAKYINSPESRLFSKSDNLYALDVARDVVAKQPDGQKHLTIMEGYTDVIVAHQCGRSDAVAVLGTALNERHLKLIKRFADRLTLVLDGDAAGKRRANDLLSLFVAEQIDLRILTLPEEMDPAEFFLERGGPAFDELLATAVDALEHKFRNVVSGIDLARDTHAAAQALEDIVATIAKAPRMAGSAASALKLREETMLARLARLFQVPETQIRTRMSGLRSFVGKNEPPRTAAEKITLDSCECEVLELLLLAPHLANQAATWLPPEEFSPGPVREIYTRLCSRAAEGLKVDFASLLTELDDPALKSILVQCDEQAQSKAAVQARAKTSIRFTPEDQLKQMVQSVRKKHASREHLAQETAVTQPQLTEQEKMELLLHSLQQQRSRQGISAPTEG